MVRYATPTLLLGLIALTLTRCATRNESSPPQLKVTSFAHPAVGGVIPVYVELDCSGCAEPDQLNPFNDKDARVPYIKREGISVLGESGIYIQPLNSVYEAIEKAGGAAPLAASVTNMSDSEAISRAMAPQPMGALELVTAPFFYAGYWAYLSTHSEAVQKKKLEDVALPDLYVSLVDKRSNEYKYNYNRGWVFFPAARYSGIKVNIYRRRPVGFLPSSEPDELIQVDTLPVVIQVDKSS